MPVLLKILSVVGTSAMIWVGGGIILHGLEVYGPPAIGHVVKSAAEAVAHTFPPLAAILEWTVEAAISGVIGLLVGAVSIPVVGFVFAPAWKSLKRFLPRRQSTSAR
jgi:predicted DNA repair protein MutK